MPTHLFLVRPGATRGHIEGKVVGGRDVDMCEVGLSQAQRAVDVLAGYDVTELISSPMSRAIQTASYFAQRYAIDATRDQRLGPVTLGSWEGRPLVELESSDDHRRFVAGDEGVFGEHLEQIHQRIRSSVQQALVDNPGDGNIVVISHTTPLRLLLAGYLGMPLTGFCRLDLDPASISVVRFDAFPRRVTVVAVNWIADGSRDLLDRGRP